MESSEHREPSPPLFVYDALLQADRDIRLLDLEWREDKNMLHGRLKPVRLKHAGRLKENLGYEALSYTWNGETPSIPIICNGKSLMITESLNLALETMCKLSSPRRLWVDAVCINQADDDEKAQQIPQIYSIYHASTQLVIWLGPSTEATNRAMDMLGQLLVKFIPVLNQFSPSSPFFQTLERLGLPPGCDVIWKGLLDILTRKWHSRLWTLQEYIAAQKATVYCGSRSANLKVLQWLNSHLFRMGLTRMMLTLREWEKGTARLSFQIFDCSSLVLLTEMIRGRECSEPVDKIYGVKALCDSLKSVKVDYSEASRKQYWNLYIEVGHLLLLEAPNIMPLSMISTSSRCLHLPSWCIDFNSLPRRDLIWDGFDAGGPSLQGFVSPHVASSWDKRRIYLRGFAVDFVVHISQPFPNVDPNNESSLDSARVLEWLEHCSELVDPHSKQVSHKSDISPEAFLRAIFCKHKTTNGFDIHELTRQYRLATLGLEIASSGRLLGNERLQSQLDRAHAVENIDFITTTCHERCFGVTSQGRLGLVPAEVRENDLLCVFRGAKVPFVLRPHRDSDRYELIGEAYVHGIMHGELFHNGRLQDEADSKVFEIV
ncbi:uncharacterized protein Z520_08024 [Fonsecaea multimorphosa CBS 102226]|uniref:Heterokaryon incompatibility domain-containing protein n=1 Tax=Fonsecaea multimorphosa CBS 102226 TaxID=1442371 RepID=A0A0D2IGR1_9EURO|nr:uncharacterized protein Z520_08024 [Fonsecaea multimorphosa CBS 102226]KIX96246.1 hypothetical protein Z520_08024 [Fonsecaea multimorphosa CBS 102226]OAL21909.1 hypothetical protein AYO22_07506 [Fonsecaea multimorphosa]